MFVNCNVCDVTNSVVGQRWEQTSLCFWNMFRLQVKVSVFMYITDAYCHRFTVEDDPLDDNRVRWIFLVIRDIINVLNLHKGTQTHYFSSNSVASPGFPWWCLKEHSCSPCSPSGCKRRRATYFTGGELGTILDKCFISSEGFYCFALQTNKTRRSTR